MNRIWLAGLFVVLGGLVLVACGQHSAPVAGPETATTKAAAPALRADWDGKWDRIVAEAKQEGVVTIYATWPPVARGTLTEAFKKKYGIDLEFSPMNSTTEIVAKLRAEKNAGLSLADALGTGVVVVRAKEEGILGRIEPLLALPEVLDATAWPQGKLPFADKDGMAVGMLAQRVRHMLHNTDLVQEGEITSVKDVLKPQYKAKIVLHDPSVAGGGNGLITHLGSNLWGEAETVDFLTRLIAEQQVVISRDYRILTDWVARGKYAVNLGPKNELWEEFIATGAPLKVAMLKEDNRIAVSSAGLAVPWKFAHPKAAVVFVNWVLSKEGQSLVAKAFGSPSARVDVSAEGINPIYIPVPGEKYYSETEQTTVNNAKWYEISKKIIAATSK